MQQHYATLPSPIGKLHITTNATQLTHINFANIDTPIQLPNTTLLQQVAEQLEAYFTDATFQFDLPLHLSTYTTLQQKIWRALQTIPLGSTQSYGTLAEKLHTSARVVGNACRANPLPIVIPCHRITAKHHLGGYAGDTAGSLLQTKRYLLQHEGCVL
jgi:methylated-DNA-[protein]-cysteine S-methyltransferase